MELGTVRIVGSVAIILGCFIFLYPKLIHPVILTVFGIGPKETPKTKDEFTNPHMRDRPPVHPGHHHDGKGIPDEMRQHMRPGPHPGMRAAAAENARQTKASSGRGGMMGVVLPMYAVGIVVYLVYTLLKVFNKKDKKDKDRDRSRDASPTHSVSEQRTLGDDEGRVSPNDPITDAKDMQRELESLANKAMDKNMKNDMRLLQQRLAETEAQMTKILQAMQSVQSRVGAEQSKGEGVQQGEATQQDKSNNQGEVIENGEKKEEEQGLNSSDISNGSSQDTESYEVIGKSDKEGSSDEASPIIDTVGPKVDMGLKDLEAVDDDDDDDDDDYEGDDNEEGSEVESEDEDILIEKKQESEEDSEVTVRKRITKTGDNDS